MGDVPTATTDFVDGGFDNPGDWNPDPDWTVVASKGKYVSSNALDQEINQGGLTFVAGNDYSIIVTLSNVAFFNPAAGINISISGGTTEPFTNIPGTQRFDIFCEETFDGTGILKFEVKLGAIPDTCNLDNVLILNNGSFVVEDLGFAVAGDVKSEFAPAVGADYQQILASRLDKSNVGILFNK